MFIIHETALSDTDKFKLDQDFTEIQEIIKSTDECMNFQHAEAGWNDQVHYGVLKLALRTHAEVGHTNM